MKEFTNYEIYKDGTIYSHLTNQFIKGCIDSAGYQKVKLRKNGKAFQKKVHRLVAIEFIPNPNNLPQVNHKDGDKLNNEVSNLEWCTAKENIQHAHETGLASNNHLKKKVLQINPSTMEVIAEFDSYREAAKALSLSEQNISQVCRGYKPKNRPNPRVTAGGFIWKTCND